MLDLEQAKLVYSGLSVGYKQVESRMQFGNTRSNIDDAEICQHVIGYDLPLEHQSKVVMYRDIDSQTQTLLQPYLASVDKIIRDNTASVGQKFIIMSTDWCGKNRHFKHLHTLLQGDRCNTFSVVIPLYIDESSETAHNFHWHYQPELYPRITYTSGDRMEKVNREYSRTELPKNSISSLKFDSSRTIHYIDNTPHLYIWVVCDAVEFESTDLITGLNIKKHL